MRMLGLGPFIAYVMGCGVVCRSGTDRMVASHASAFCLAAALIGNPV